MDRTRSDEKRIKRRIVGRRHSFFVATAPHLNRVCKEELLSLNLPIGMPAAVSGGVLFTGRLPDCYAANLKLRTANRILMRIAVFEATNFRQLEKAAEDIPWELYLRPEAAPRLSVSVKNCRLYHSRAVGDHFIAGMSKRRAALDSRALNPTPPEEGIFIRGKQDVFTLSIDSSGPLLYKRGLKSHGAKAPMRETLTAAALLIARYTGAVPLIDPMCGSGTCALEAAMIAGNIPPGWYRTFAFMHWPAFRPKTWRYLRKEAQTRFSFPAETMVHASDVDAAAVTALEQAIGDSGLAGTVDVRREDFFRFHPASITRQPGVVFLNPPYGVRMETSAQSAARYRRIADKLRRDYKNWTFVLAAPRKKDMLRLFPHHAVHPIVHGGLDLCLLVGKI